MILYTIMPEQLIYPADYSQCEREQIVNVNGVEMVVSEQSNQCYSVVRILSTNPAHYLQYEPGQKITFE
ncbi:YlzJ-like family protein [Bacillus gaemokensis]|uniref:Ribonuclease n=1 Tax=Bacillus gaemokensis TaxID=574375 RepID=A0A073KGX3_9BACI|nr:YlzJ-like family protein [Bacillus gaemokensis]KEK25692.1 ribonuclease [Bacillus gaemokensis]KYG38509.1 ribonuclease [Bacillus gaemokensis]